MARIPNQNTNQNKQGGNTKQSELHVLTNDIKTVKRVGSNLNDVNIAEKVMEGSVRKTEIESESAWKAAQMNIEKDLKIAEMKAEKAKRREQLEKELKEFELKCKQDIELRKIELEARNEMVGKIVDGAKWVATTTAVSFYLYKASKQSTNEEEMY